MTQYTGEATQRQKLAGCVEGIVNAVVERIATTAKDFDPLPLQKALTEKVKPLVHAICDLGEDKGKATPPKELVALTTNVQQAVNDFIAAEKLVLKEATVIGVAIRNQCQEAHTAGWEK